MTRYLRFVGKLKAPMFVHRGFAGTKVAWVCLLDLDCCADANELATNGFTLGGTNSICRLRQ
jgi:hypothetical protein